MNLKGFFSIEERKSSTLIFSLLVLIVLVAANNILKRPIDAEITNIIQSLIFGIVGVNGMNALDNYATYKAKMNAINEQDMIYNNNQTTDGGNNPCQI